MAQIWEYRSVIIARKAESNAEFTVWVEISAEGVKQLTGRVDMTQKANELGQQGWELVSVTPISGKGSSVVSGAGYSDWAGFTDNILYWFKRPK